jgi:hypothetical protein
MNREIMLCAGVYVPDNEAGQMLCHPLVCELSEAVKAIAARHGVKCDGRVAFVYVGSDDVNARPCDRCGEWTTNLAEPERVECLAGGNLVADGRLLCGHCLGMMRSKRK